MDATEFDALYAALRALRDAGFAGGAALATLLRTRGPVFRRPGARMLVLGDGRIVRGLSAGCPEADIAARALEVITQDTARLQRYDREHGYDALLELGCGGEMEVLIEPLRREADLQHTDAIADGLRARRSTLQFTVFAADGSCLPRPRRLLCSGDTICHDSLDDAALRDSLLAQRHALSAESAAQARAFTGPRGEALQVFVETLQPALRLVLIGRNATTAALARQARVLGWQVRVVDHLGTATAAEDAADLIVATPEQLPARGQLDAHSAVVVMTHNLERDLAYLRALRDTPLKYLGALGSRQRAAKMQVAIGATAARLHVPAGLDIGSETPEEIALAIAAEIQAELRGHAGAQLSRGSGPIH